MRDFSDLTEREILALAIANEEEDGRIYLDIAEGLRDDAAEVNAAVWTRGVIVVASALLTLTFTVRAARGSRRAYLRLRIASAVMVVAIAVILALPGTFPLWMRIEQGVCGLLLLGVVVVVNGRRLRASFAAG